jgi:hypothetical protein
MNTDRRHAGCFLDQASQKGLGEAQLANAAGKYLLPDAQSIKAGAAGFASQTPANEAVSLINGPAPDGYPIFTGQSPLPAVAGPVVKLSTAQIGKISG